MRNNSHYSNHATKTPSTLGEWLEQRLVLCAQANTPWPDAAKEVFAVSGRMLRKSELLYHYEAMV
ncbi:hypothetical protein KBC79_00430, partial [Candidatus Woesebacteria bacterium]|nr:hypothetical protein [Candidatus Woesebacteria bacterium]